MTGYDYASLVLCCIVVGVMVLLSILAPDGIHLNRTTLLMGIGGLAFSAFAVTVLHTIKQHM